MGRFNRHANMSRLTFVLLSYAFFITLLTAQERQIKHDKVFFNSVVLSDPDTVAIILDQVMLDVKNPTSVEIIDLNADGFGINDFLKVNPSGVGLFLTDLDVSERLRKILKKLPPPLNEQMTFARPEDAKDFHEEEKTPESSILVTFVEMLDKSYKGKDIKLMLQLTDKGYTFEISGFQHNLAEYHPPLMPGMERIVEEMGPDQVLRAFFENLKKKYIHELVMVREVRVDTVFVSRD
ncbi:hypothetical protein JXJ21_16300 [candidate division KSB1 bacterium]|nr:hypothetical protein [candidate division KSB1 bacterium]